MLEQVGENRLDYSAHRSAWRLLAAQFVSPIELILIFATVLSGILGDWTDTMIILTILLLSGLLGFVQERGAGRAVAALLASIEVTAVALRDGVPAKVAVSRIVPGDVVTVAAGDIVPGDCLVLSSNGLSVDESVLTGEAFPADKAPAAVPTTASLHARSNAVFLGTHVVSGTGRLLVVRTGRTTELAGISDRIESRRRPTGFEHGMTAFGLLLTRVMVVLVVAIFVINLLLHRGAIESVLFSLALAVGLTPQLLPAIVGISLAQGARRMAAEHVIVRRLDAIEDFGSLTVLCSDKTGTLTAGRIVLDHAAGVGGAPSDRVLELASLNAGLQQGWRNPIDDAVLAVRPCPADATALAELPYDFDRKLLSVLVHQHDEGLMITKGALSSVLDRCTHAVTQDGVVPLGDCLDQIEQRFATLSAGGFRVLGLATRRLPAGRLLQPDDEADLTLAGILTFADPMKPGIAATVRQLADSGVALKIITGDNHLVAGRLAREVGFDQPAECLGDQLDALSDADLVPVARSTDVFSELNPLQKERIVQALRADGQVVGYVGDGINDAPALNAADVGISVDTAVSVAKQSAAIILLDKDLKVILDGIRLGRRTFANTMKYIFLTTSANFGNMLSMAVAAIALPFLPLLAGQILLVNLLTDLPATAIATDTVDASQLRRPQTWNVRLIRNSMIVFGMISSVFDLTTFAALIWLFHAEPTEFRSAWFLGSVLTEIAVLFALRTRGPCWRSRPSPVIVLISVTVALAALAIPYSPLAAPLALTAIPLELLILIIAITLGYVLATEIAKRLFWSREAAVERRGRGSRQR